MLKLTNMKIVEGPSVNNEAKILLKPGESVRWRMLTVEPEGSRKFGYSCSQLFKKLEI